MAKTNINEEMMNKMMNAIEEMNEKYNSLEKELSSLKKNVQYKKKIVWPICDPSVEINTVYEPNYNKYLDFSSGGNKGYYSLSRCGLSGVQDIIKNLREEDENNVKGTMGTKYLAYGNRGGGCVVFKDMLVKKECLFKNWITEYDEPDKSVWFENNNIFNLFGSGFYTDIQKRKKFIEYKSVNPLNENFISISGTEYTWNKNDMNSCYAYEIKTTDEKIKAFIMNNREYFRFIKLVEDDKGLTQWEVVTRDATIITKMFE